jgi:UDP-N-acetyl-D-mannosaminuronic acid dehydrogenase
VICTDPFIKDPSFDSLEKVLSESDILIIAAPHRAYKKLDLAGRDVVDIWGITGPIRL